MLFCTLIESIKTYFTTLSMKKLFSFACLTSYILYNVVEKVNYNLQRNNEIAVYAVTKRKITDLSRTDWMDDHDSSGSGDSDSYLSDILPPGIPYGDDAILPPGNN